MGETLNKIWIAVRKDRVGPVLGWNVPLALALFGYFLACQKLLFLQETGLTIALWNEKTERAIGATCWTHDHLWIFLVFALVLNVVFLVRPRQKLWTYTRYGIFFFLLASAFWYFDLESYLTMKILGPPNEQNTAVTQTTK